MAIDSRTAEKIRVLISNARLQGVPDKEILSGHYSGYEDVADLVDDYIVKGYRLSESEYCDFANQVLAQNTPVMPVVGIESTDSVETPIHVSEGGAWDVYKHTLESAGFDEESIKDTTLYARWIVSRLIKNGDKPCKGLVMGSVQSGKTANMGAVMSMAADMGFNFIVVFSGVLNALRDQTMDRFESDLKSVASVQWELVDLNDKRVDLRECDFSACSAKRYLVVCIKHSRRLNTLGRKLEELKVAKQNVRMLIIDDEADQAGINSNELSPDLPIEDRTTTNRAIVKLVTNRLCPQNKVSNVPFRAINYVCYTATPYANILNEPPGADSLYPSSFVLSLPEPRTYFGTKVIFGNPDDDTPGLNIIREISTDEAHAVGAKAEASTTVELPAFKRALAWFLCAAACLRERGYSKPISMLVHPSARVFAHQQMDKILFSWLVNCTDEELVSFCESIYDDEKSAFTKQDLNQHFPGGYKLIDNVPESPLPFDKIKDGILRLKHKVDRVKGTERKSVEYHDGIHVCVDNSKAPKDGKNYFRIAYPSKKVLETLSVAPVFIVIGGATLSRGLTIEGLVCSYFAREVKQADSLMQMARWFGFRKGYELYQRIWMTRLTQAQFRQMTRMDVALKRELDTFRIQNRDPSQYGPEVLCFPDSVRLRLTSEKHMQSAQVADISYNGFSFETTEFVFDAECQKANVARTQNFVKQLGCPGFVSSRGTGGVVWTGVPAEDIVKFFKNDFKIWDGSLISREMPSFCEWALKEAAAGSYGKWSVAVCGPSMDPAIGAWSMCDGVGVGCIGRTRHNDGPKECIDIGSLRAGLDALIDIKSCDLAAEQREVLQKAEDDRKELIRVRSKLGKSDVPLLLIYAIDSGDSALKPRSGSHRSSINLGKGSKIAAISVIVPGDPFGKNHVQKVTVRI